jgi:hypothetical protein
MARIYFSFLLRLWRSENPAEPAWYASLEDPHTRQVRAFRDLAALHRYLRGLTAGTGAADGPEEAGAGEDP